MRTNRDIKVMAVHLILADGTRAEHGTAVAVTSNLREAMNEAERRALANNPGATVERTETVRR